jgi:CubicO group peptidase (beta-lactamase class C family)
MGGLTELHAGPSGKEIPMRKCVRLIASAAVLLAAVSVVRGQDVQAQNIGANADQYLSAWAKQGRFSGAVLLAKGDKILLRKGYGMANFELNVANTPETVFRIGSITKLFTAFSILQLEEKGLLKVTDPVSKYIPEMPADWDGITIHLLLCHKSGIPDFTSAKAYSEFDNPRHIENALKEYSGKPLLTKPGDVLRYSNAGYILLGRVIEKVSGKSYEEHLTENILRPAGMTHTSVDHAAELVPQRASGYRFDGENIINATYGDPAYTYSAGALRSTVDDMYRFDRALKSGRLFSAAITAKAWTAYGHWTAPPPFPLEAEYGYGWMIGQDQGHRYVGHGGWVNGFVSQFTRYPDDDAVLIVLWNFETSNNIPLTQDLAAILFGQKYEVPIVRPIVHPAAETLARYVGRYQVGPLTLQITVRNGRLYALGTGQPAPYGLIATTETEFYCNDMPAVVMFVPGEKGTVDRVTIRMSGKDTELTRVAEPKQGE